MNSQNPKKTKTGASHPSESSVHANRTGQVSIKGIMPADIYQSIKESEQAHHQENYRTMSHRTTIGVWKAWICFTKPRADGKKSLVRYNLEELDSNPPKAYIALENHIRKIRETDPLYSHAFMYIRRDDIPNGTPIGTIRDTEAFTQEFFQYHKDPTKNLEYLKRVQGRIETLRTLGYVDAAIFLQEVFNRAITNC